MTTPLEMESERLTEMKEFDKSKMGVKALLDSGITTIPNIFIYPPENLIDLKPSLTHFQIPIIDLSITPQSKIVDQICTSLSTWGFFQVTNHGIPMQVIQDTIQSFMSFHEQPTEVKQTEYVWDQKVQYYSNFNISSCQAVNWKDSLRVFTSPNPPELEAIPSVCRKELVEWDEYLKRLCEVLMELICEGLGVEKNRLKELTCSEGRKFLCHYYPYCPQPDLTLGLPSHTDRGVLTLLLQNEVKGLQVKYGGQWVEVKPIQGAIVVNAGDLLQIFSNDQIQSVEHRVVANPCKNPRISIGVIFNPGKGSESDYYGPLPELLSSDNPARYRNFNMSEIRELGKTYDSGSKPLVDLFKLKVQLDSM